MNNTNNKKNNLWNICWCGLGVAVGIASIIIGCIIINMKPDAADNVLPYTFGADFYTEMYSATRDIYMLLRNRTWDIFELLATCFGWIFILSGVGEICFFGKNITIGKREPEEQSIVMEDELPEL